MNTTKQLTQDEADFLKSLIKSGKVQAMEKGLAEVERVTGFAVTPEVHRSTPEEAEEAEAVLCLELSFDQPMLFPDNVKANCADCETLLQHRPHVPQKPAKLCLTCLMKRVAGQP